VPNIILNDAITLLFSQLQSAFQNVTVSEWFDKIVSVYFM